MSRPAAAHGDPAPASDQELRLVISEVGGITVGIEAVEVEVAAGEPAGETAGETIDLAAFWDLPTSTLARRALALRGPAERTVWLVLGPSATLKLIPRSARLDLPIFIQALAQRAGVCSLLALDHGLGYLLDVERLTGRRARGHQP